MFAIGRPLSALTGIKEDYFSFAIWSCWVAAFVVTGWPLVLFPALGVTNGSSELGGITIHLRESASIVVCRNGQTRSRQFKLRH
jgi:hypothetical protein